MKRRRLLLLLAIISIAVLIGGNVPVASSESSGPMLRMAFIQAQSPAEVTKLAQMGIDIAAVRKGAVVTGARGVPTQTYRVEAVVSVRDEKKLSSEGYSWTEVPGKGPAKKVGEPYKVYHSYDEPINGIRDQLYKIAATYPKIAQVQSIGQTIQRRPMLAIRLTSEKGSAGKPQVLFLGTHHAREWVATETAMRLIKYLTANYGAVDRVTNLLDNVEVWVMPVGNPDGYQYTFTTERLWRKNLRDNDGDGQITIADGVDLNRNFGEHWGYDDEGSSPSWSDETYRGAAPDSEPETQAVENFIKSNNFKFIMSYHTYGDLILYPWGWQVKTNSSDDPIFVAQAGTDANPGVWDSLMGQGYDPGVSADLYTTNGEFTDWAYNAGVPAQTIELTYGEDTADNFYGFEFPDDEAMVQQVFEDNLPFALAYAESAQHPAHPVSPVGIETYDVYHTPVKASYGSSQIVEVLARRGLSLTLKYSVDGGAERTASFTEKLGTVYNDEPGLYYGRYRAVIEGQRAGDAVTYRVLGGGNAVGPYSYSVASATGNPILIVAAEDYSGDYPKYQGRGKPHYLDYYTAALDGGGYRYDVWDVDAHDAPPSYADVLSHYKTAIWYTGDDYLATVPDWGVGEQETLNLRDFMNYDGGRLFATGQDLAWSAAAYGLYPDDFFQYYLGAYMHVEEGGMDRVTGLPFPVKGEAGDPVFGGLDFNLYGGTGANNQSYADTFLTTSHFLPHFDNTLAARYSRPGGPYDPHSGSYYVYSQMADSAYKRLGGTFAVPAGSPTLTFWVSADTEPNWDFAFVEVSEVGSGNWTTLPDLNGLTTTNTGDSCASGWVDEIHPFLAHYMDASCSPTGTTGSWNAFTGNTGGWRQMKMDLSAYAGKTVELYISYASDWATQGLGVFLDDVQVAGQPVESFETGLGQFTVSVAPGSTAFNNWTHMQGAAFPEGPAIRTPNSVYFGFGFEAIDTAANRSAVMDRVMRYLLR